jgi:hypothetical protein
MYAPIADPNRLTLLAVKANTGVEAVWVYHMVRVRQGERFSGGAWLAPTCLEGVSCHCDTQVSRPPSFSPLSRRCQITGDRSH